jgi:hypothetical protein
MSPRSLRLVVIAMACAGLLTSRLVSAAGRKAPPFPAAGAEAWIGAPQRLDTLRGKVVLLDVWTYG